MDTAQILKCILQLPELNKVFLGAFPIDKLPPRRFIKYPCALIVNFDKSTEKGSHWVSIFIAQNGYGFYFDSAGKQPPDQIERFLNRNCIDWEYFTERVQKYVTKTCGEHCIFFLDCKIQNKDPLDEYSMFISENDLMVKEFVRKFDLKVKLKHGQLNQVSDYLVPGIYSTTFYSGPRFISQKLIKVDHYKSP